MPDNKILRRQTEPGLAKGEEVITYRDALGNIRNDVIIPDGQFPSPKALDMSVIFCKNHYEKE